MNMWFFADNAHSQASFNRWRARACLAALSCLRDVGCAFCRSECVFRTRDSSEPFWTWNQTKPLLISSGTWVLWYSSLPVMRKTTTWGLSRWARQRTFTAKKSLQGCIYLWASYTDHWCLNIQICRYTTPIHSQSQKCFRVHSPKSPAAHILCQKVNYCHEKSFVAEHSVAYQQHWLPR